MPTMQWPMPARPACRAITIERARLSMPQCQRGVVESPSWLQRGKWKCSGTGSSPPVHSGWQRSNRQAVSALPRHGPKRVSAIRA